MVRAVKLKFAVGRGQKLCPIEHLARRPGPAKPLASRASAKYTRCRKRLWLFWEALMLALTRPRARTFVHALALAIAGLALAGCGINTIPTLQEQAKA